MEAARKLKNLPSAGRKSGESGNIIQMWPHVERQRMRACFEEEYMNSFKSHPADYEKSADIIEMLAHILKTVSIPEFVSELIKLLDERIRAQKASAAFATANEAFSKDMRNFHRKQDIVRKTTGIIRRRRNEVPGSYKQEETNRIFILTGHVDGKVEDVLVWET